MSVSVFHRKCISAVFIALYVFIVTPASTWHHHSVIFKGTTQKANGSSHAFSLDNASGVSCKICAHHYSIFDNDAYFPIIVSAAYGITPSGISLTPSFTGSNTILSDRAPPAV
ncbi:MAG: hypothetical protein EBX50_02470 [Chitinophagia bacterium]|nr:hypothetical protein [Chitinophagia bacterium]